MPWDGTELWVAELDDRGMIKSKRKIAGGVSESIFQPEWSKSGLLYYIGDVTGWWNPYVLHPADTNSAPWQILKMEKEFGLPHWVFGMSTYALKDDGTIIGGYCDKGKWKLCKIEVDFAAKKSSLKDIDVPFGDLDYFALDGDSLACCASSPETMSSVVEIDTKTGAYKIIRKSNELEVDKKYISVAEVAEFPTADGQTAYALVYKPSNADFRAPDGELPPLLVESHGGPTSATGSSLNLHIQYWTSRGFVVADVNYRGSTGYGREYRDKLKLQWGIADVQDCENAARYLASKGVVDPKRMAITGGSAGGYTTLCALTFGDVFHAGASHYGIGDVSALAADTHKFEARYLDTLIGPYPKEKAIYDERSPLNYTDKLTCPVIFFQGLEDKAVPPSQAESMVAALRKKKLPVAYITYPGEQHGFRQAENIKRTLEAEFYFYSRIFKFTPADKIEPVQIDNLDDPVGVRR
jgi:dipeptidyl aminopeptidase/acylaminoacyl peptidase